MKKLLLKILAATNMVSALGVKAAESDWVPLNTPQEVMYRGKQGSLELKNGYASILVSRSADDDETRLMQFSILESACAEGKGDVYTKVLNTERNYTIPFTFDSKSFNSSVAKVICLLVHGKKGAISEEGMRVIRETPTKWISPMTVALQMEAPKAYRFKF